MLYLIAQILIVAFSSWLFTKKYFRVEACSDSILVSFLLFFGQIVLAETFLGIFGQLYFSNIFIVHLLTLSIALLIPSRVKIPSFIKPDLKPFINNNLILFAASVFGSFALIAIYNNLINPPLDADSLLYHLAFPASWIKSGSLNMPFFIFSSSPAMIPGSLEISSPSYYPINANLFFAWLMLPLNNIFLADLGQIPFYFIGILAVYSILRKYDLSQKTALLSGFILMIIPTIFKQLKTAAQIDVICMVLFLLVFATLLLLKRNFTFKNAILFGIATGLFIGVKFNNVVWFGALLPLILFILYKGLKLKEFSVVKKAIFVASIGSMIILFGGYMYIKNYVLTRNPIFPVDLKIFGKTIFKGLVDTATYRIHLFSRDASNLLRIFREGLGPQFFALILPATFLPLISHKYLKIKAPFSRELRLLLFIPLIALILFKVFIGVYITRYFYPYLSLGLLTAVIFVAKLPKGEKYLAAVSFISIAVAAFQLAHRYELITSILLSLACFILLVRFRKQLLGFYENKNFGKFILIGLIPCSLLLIYFNNKYNSEEYDRYVYSLGKNEKWQVDLRKGWQALNEITKKGTRVAYTGRQEAYPLYGTGLKNEVKYVSINEKEITPYNNPDGLYRKIQDFSAWRENLKKYKAEYLFIAKPVFENRESIDPNKFPIEDEWAIAHPEDFQLVFNNSLSRIYKVMIK